MRTVLHNRSARLARQRVAGRASTRRYAACITIVNLKIPSAGDRQKENRGEKARKKKNFHIFIRSLSRRRNTVAVGAQRIYSVFPVVISFSRSSRTYFSFQSSVRAMETSKKRILAFIRLFARIFCLFRSFSALRTHCRSACTGFEP